jgi:RNA polymerase sigma-70 factor (ECF subfamily)
MNEEDVARWYADYGYIVLRRCLAYLRDLPTAEDAVQEVFVRALDNVAAFRGDASPRTWLCRIADHLCIDILRRNRRNPVRVLESDDLERAISNDDRTVFVGVSQLLGQLDLDSQRLAVLYFLDELTQEEVAKELGLSRRTVGKRIKLLVERARVSLGEEFLS